MADALRLQLTSQGAVLAVTAKPQRLHNLPCNSQHHLPLHWWPRRSCTHDHTAPRLAPAMQSTRQQAAPHSRVESRVTSHLLSCPQPGTDILDTTVQQLCLERPQAAAAWPHSTIHALPQEQAGPGLVARTVAGRARGWLKYYT